MELLAQWVLRVLWAPVVLEDQLGQVVLLEHQEPQVHRVHREQQEAQDQLAL